jgi:hypothetical protein
MTLSVSITDTPCQTGGGNWSQTIPTFSSYKVGDAVDIYTGFSIRYTSVDGFDCSRISAVTSQLYFNLVQLTAISAPISYNSGTQSLSVETAMSADVGIYLLELRYYLTSDITEGGNIAFQILIIVGEPEEVVVFPEVETGDELNIGGQPEAEELNTPPQFTATSYILFVPIGYSSITFSLPSATDGENHEFYYEFGEDLPSYVDDRVNF